jgi:hypothetical protein
MAGLQTWAPDGRLTVDMTKRLSQMQGSVVTNGGNGSIAVPPAPNGKKQFFIVVPLQDLQTEKGKKPGVTLGNGVLSWSYVFQGGWGFFAANCRIFYGYY